MVAKKTVSKKTKKEKKAKKLKVGSLVFVKTHNPIENWGWSTSGVTTTTIPAIGISPYIGGGGTLTSPSISSPWIGNNYNTVGIIDEYTKTYYGHEDANSLVYGQSDNTENYKSIIKNAKFSKEDINDLKVLYNSYLANNSTTKVKPGRVRKNKGTTLGMTTYNGWPPYSTTSAPKIKVHQYYKPYISPTTTITAGSSTATIQFPTSIEVEYQAKGYRNINDYFLSNPTLIRQEEKFTEEEVKKMTEDGDLFVTWGKPFKGIIVDVFEPKFETAKGEKIDLGLTKIPTMYKVLVSEKDCLWFTEEDVYEMMNED